MIDIEKEYEELIAGIAVDIGFDENCDLCRGRGEVPNPPLPSCTCDCDWKQAEALLLEWVAENKFAQLWGDSEREKREAV